MDQGKTDGGGREQTLLEAAKVFIGDDWGSTSLRNLRAAIDREEAKPVSDYDRAQQAEAEAKWHREESARLRAELAKGELASYWALNCSERAGRWKERAEKAEADAAWHKAESARLSAELAKRKAAVESTAPFVMWRERAEKAEAQVLKLIALQVNPVASVPESANIELQTHAFGSNVVVGKTDPDHCDVRDPATGWTFATYRRVVEALGGGPRVVG